MTKNAPWSHRHQRPGCGPLTLVALPLVVWSMLTTNYRLGPKHGCALILVAFVASLLTTLAGLGWGIHEVIS